VDSGILGETETKRKEGPGVAHRSCQDRSVTKRQKEDGHIILWNQSTGEVVPDLVW